MQPILAASKSSYLPPMQASIPKNVYNTDSSHKQDGLQMTTEATEHGGEMASLGLNESMHYYAERTNGSIHGLKNF